MDRAAWARVVRQAMAERTRGKITPFARLVEVNPRTVSRWIDEEVDVSEESVREVARKIDVSPITLLIEVGYYSHAEASAGGELDEEEEMVLRADVDDETKRRALEQLHLMRLRDKRRRMEDLGFLLGRSPGDVG